MHSGGGGAGMSMNMMGNFHPGQFDLASYYPGVSNDVRVSSLATSASQDIADNVLLKLTSLMSEGLDDNQMEARWGKKILSMVCLFLPFCFHFLGDRNWTLIVYCRHYSKYFRRLRREQVLVPNIHFFVRSIFFSRCLLFKMFVDGVGIFFLKKQFSKKNFQGFPCRMDQMRRRRIRRLLGWTICWWRRAWPVRNGRGRWPGPRRRIVPPVDRKWPLRRSTPNTTPSWRACGNSTRTGAGTTVRWAIDWLIAWLSDYSIDWLIDWLMDCLSGWLMDWVSDCSFDWLIDGSSG